MNTQNIDIEPIIAHVEEGFAIDGTEHPGYEALAAVVREELETLAEEFGGFDINNNEHFAAIVEEVAAAF